MPQIKGFQVDLNASDLGDGFATGKKSTGLLTGGEITFGTLTGSPGTTALFSVSAGTGVVVDSYTDPENPTPTFVTWPAFTDIAVTNIATADRTFVAINIGGSPTPNIVQQITKFTPAQHRDNIVLGTIGHVNNVNVVAIRNDPPAAFDTDIGLVDFAKSIGPFNVEGNIYEANGTNLNVDKTVGSSYRVGNNFHTDKASPDITTESERLLRPG